jgi:phytoene synthase
MVAGLNRNEAEEQTEQIIQIHSRTFYFATRLLPRAARKAVGALYAFCRTSDDLVDRAGATREDVEAWRAQVCQPLQAQTDPVLICWAQTRQAYHIDQRYEQELIDGVAMDIDFKPYNTWQDLQKYCYRVASTVGLLSMPIIGLAPGASFEEAAPFATKLGIALQLTNILRDIGEDKQRGRVYLPLEDLEQFGLTLNDIYLETHDQRFIDLMKFEIARARQLYQEALPGIKLLSPSARPSVGAAALLYRAILNEIEKNNYQVYTRRAYTTTARKLLMLPGILLTIARL